MPETYGNSDFGYNFVENWAKLPSDMTFQECPGVAVDSRDNVYVLTRGEHPIIVFDKDGKFIRSFGEGLFSNRTHGLYISRDDSVLAADDGIHTIQKFNSEGDKLMEIGERNHPAPRWQSPYHRGISTNLPWSWHMSDLRLAVRSRLRHFQWGWAPVRRLVFQLAEVLMHETCRFLTRVRSILPICPTR